MKKKMVRLEITNNETGTDEGGNYSYVIRIGAKVISEGSVTNHKRGTGYAGLLALISAAEITKEKIK